MPSEQQRVIPAQAGTVPAAAKWLGLSGLLPFAGLSLALPLLSPDQRSLALTALLAYGAVILSFLGGIHWGLAIRQDDALWHRLGLSVVPSLVAWLALGLGGSPGLLLLAAMILLTLILDRHATRDGIAPDWYLALRWPLSLVAAALLLWAALVG
jgi:hypothetical protein